MVTITEFAGTAHTLTGEWFIEDWTGEVVWARDNER